MVDPDRGRAGGPVAMDDKGGGTGEAEERLGGQVVVVQFAATVEVGASVEQESHVQGGSHEAVSQVEVGEVITRFACFTFLLAWSHNMEDQEVVLQTQLLQMNSGFM